MSSSKPSEIKSEIRPIIGILSYDIDFAIRDAYQFGQKYPFYISSSFMKWIESAGGQVIPIWADRDDDYYRTIMKQINGILFPGGQFWFNDPENGKAAYSARKIYDIAIEMNENGNYFPIWGTTLGFQLLFYAASGSETNARQEMTLYQRNEPFHFENDVLPESKLFGQAGQNYLDLLANQPVASYYSIYCVTPEILAQFNLTNDWLILSTATNNENEKFITSAEHKKYPFYGVIAHLQKSQFENSKFTNHSNDACIASQYFANFFVEEAKKNQNTMTNETRLNHSIYNFAITYVEPRVPKFTGVYLFEKDADYPKIPNSNIPVNQNN